MALAGVVLVAALAAYVLLKWLTPETWPRWLLLPGVLLAGGLGWSRAPGASSVSHHAAQPIGVQTTPPPAGYATSASCRSCHPAEYRS